MCEPPPPCRILRGPAAGAMYEPRGTSIRLLAARLERTNSPNELVPLATIISATSPRKEKVVEWSRAYRVSCLSVALCVGMLPLLLVGVAMATMPSDDSSGGGGGDESSSAIGSLTSGDGVSGGGRRCDLQPMMSNVNSSLLTRGSNATVVALAMIFDEGPRGEFRRKARETVADKRARALANGLHVFAFEPCIRLPPGTSSLLVGASAGAACRVARAAIAHRCSPPSPPSEWRSGPVALSSNGGRASTTGSGSSSRSIMSESSSSSSSSSSGGGGGSAARLGDGSSHGRSDASMVLACSRPMTGPRPAPGSLPTACQSDGTFSTGGARNGTKSRRLGDAFDGADENSRNLQLRTDGCCPPPLARGSRRRRGQGRALQPEKWNNNKKAARRRQHLRSRE